MAAAIKSIAITGTMFPDYPPSFLADHYNLFDTIEFIIYCSQLIPPFHFSVGFI